MRPAPVWCSISKPPRPSQQSFRLFGNTDEGLTTMTDLQDRHTAAMPVQQLFTNLLQNLQGQRGRPRGESENAHGGTPGELCEGSGVDPAGSHINKYYQLNVAAVTTRSGHRSVPARGLPRCARFPSGARPQRAGSGARPAYCAPERRFHRPAYARACRLS